MNFSFENQGTRTYLVYTVDETDAIDSMSLGMLTNNKISGLAQTIFTQMDATKYIKYDVSAKISVRQFFTGPVNKKRLIGVFNGIADAMLSAEDYMIDVNSILLDLDYIFADVSSCETVLVCLPVISDDLSNIDLGAFFKQIMFTTQFDQTENCDHVAKIINYLNSSPVFSLIDFKKLLDSISNAQTLAQPQPSVVQVQPQPQPQQVQPQIQPTSVMQNVVPQSSVQTPVQQTFAQKSVQIQQGENEKQSNQFSAKTQGNILPVEKQQAMETPENQISWFYLMQHYNKENAELYKQQKAAKKAEKAQSKSTPAQKTKKQLKQAEFAIPGQQTSVNQGFAIPGQQTSINPGFAIPGQPVPVQQAPEQQPVQPQVQQTAVNQPAYTQPQMPQGQTMNFGETTVLSSAGIGETTVLGVTPAIQIQPHLIRLKNNEKINVDKPVFRIGKEKSFVDYFIGDNSAISRSHANIISRDGEYFVVDTNSMNHTYVNGQMIQSNAEMKIDHGMKIRFANEDFEFRVY